MIEHLTFNTSSQGLFEITEEVQEVVHKSTLTEALCVLHVKHTSASLLIQENADPSARRDLENWLKRLVPEKDPLYTHTTEGSDDMPAHVKAAITNTSLSIPVEDGRLTLGTWQGIYIWEHRKIPHKREVVVYVG